MKNLLIACFLGIFCVCFVLEVEAQKEYLAFEIHPEIAKARITFALKNMCTPPGTCDRVPSVRDPGKLRDQLLANFGSDGVLLKAGFATNDDVNLYYEKRHLNKPVAAAEVESVKHYYTYIIRVEDETGRARYFDLFTLCPPPSDCVSKVE
ncbi:MAG: hypothetical protein JWQ27_586 [Ferruginibacter sp.]|nr:hypothetical protein [Ferruginibacter sp.]